MGENEVQDAEKPRGNIRIVVPNRGPREEDGVYFSGEIFGQTVSMLVDTGSYISLMNLTTWDRLKLPGLHLHETTVQPTGAEGGKLTLHGRRDIPIKINDVQLTHNIDIGECTMCTADDDILGMDFLKMHVTAMDVEALTMRLGADDVTLTYYQPMPTKVRVILSRTTVRGTSGSTRITDALIEGEALQNNREWVVARALVRVTQGQVHVRILNLGE